VYTSAQFFAGRSVHGAGLNTACLPQFVSMLRMPKPSLDRGGPPTSDKLQREVATLIKQSADLKAQAHELFKTADNLRHKAEGLLSTHSQADESS
jgi:hypothetical protein